VRQLVVNLPEQT